MNRDRLSIAVKNLPTASVSGGEGELEYCWLPTAVTIMLILTTKVAAISTANGCTSCIVVTQRGEAVTKSEWDATFLPRPSIRDGLVQFDPGCRGTILVDFADAERYC